ncbi:MAG: hypothetical protein H6570_14500 [Lewinellaceae bacterium]|nr:hypothetical protein [Lewinellaceae bacterium]
MTIIRLITLFLLLQTFSVDAQEQFERNANPKAPFEERLALKLEYFGELVLHPGLSVGLQYTVIKNNWITVHWDVDLGGYWHRWNNKSGFLKTSIGSRFAMGPLFTDLNIGIGYLHAWADGDIYQQTEAGAVEKTANWGHPHFMPNMSILIGWDGSRRPWTVHLGPEVYLQSSFNHQFLPHIAVKMGITYKFNKQ